MLMCVFGFGNAVMGRQRSALIFPLLLALLSRFKIVSANLEGLNLSVLICSSLVSNLFLLCVVLWGRFVFVCDCADECYLKNSFFIYKNWRMEFCVYSFGVWK